MAFVSNEAGASVDGAAIARSLAAPEEFAEVFDRHFRAVHRYLARRVGRDQAEDLASQTFMLAFAHRERYNDDLGSARSWLLGIATNLVRADHRSERHRLAMLQALASEGPGAAALTNGSPHVTVGHEVAAALAALDPPQRDALLLHVWGELSYAEVAYALDIPVGTVRSRISRACAALRDTVGRRSHA